MDSRAVIEELRNALNLIMSPLTEPNLRRTAYQFCEDFKENSENCAECGILMASTENNEIVRHFGLQLLEHCIKLKWNNMDLDKKKFIKENALSLVSSGTLGISSEHKHIKDALSRIVVEIVKREWPQQWVSMVAEFDAICSQGRTQTELILMVFLRLAEDVLIFQTTPPQRRKEILQGLTAIIPQLFSFFCLTLASNYAAYKAEKDHPEVANGCVRVIGVTCEVLCSFMENIDIDLLTADRGQLILLLLEMLREEPMRGPVVDCLLEIASKKGKSEERQPMVNVLLASNSLDMLRDVAMASERNCTTEQGFLFFKKLCQVVVVMGTQLVSILICSSSSKLPTNFNEYMALIMSFTTHPSQAVSCYCMPLWSALLKCDRVNSTGTMRDCIVQLFLSSVEMLMKVGNPSQESHVKCTYARFDFDCDDEFQKFFRKYRSELWDVIRSASTLCPEVAFGFATSQLTSVMNKTINSGQLDAPSLSFLYVGWEAVVSCLECVMEKMDFENFNDDTILTAVSLYKQVIDFHASDPTICSYILSVISSFFPLIIQDASILSKVLDKLFACLLFNIPGQTKSTRSKVVKNVRRHACSMLVKICKMYPDLLLPGFNHLYNHIKKLSTNPEELSQMEKCTCYEALILIHNTRKNYEEQAIFLNEIMQPVSSYWLSDSLTQTIWSAEKLMDFVGVTCPPVKPSSEDICGINRSQIQYFLAFILGVLKRSSWPTSPEEALAGGFIQGYSADSTPIHKSPASGVIVPLLNNIFAIIRSYHEFFLPNNFSRVHPDFIASFYISESDRLNMMGIVKPTGTSSDGLVAVTKDPIERMQAFFNTFSEFGYRILGNCCTHLGQEFYSIPSLANTLLTSVFNNIFILPELKIKQLIHIILKPLVSNCPREYHSSVVLPVIRALAPFFYQYLMHKWQNLSNKREGRETLQDGSDSQENQELLEEHLLKSVTGEYFNIIDCLLRDRKSRSSAHQAPSNFGEGVDDNMMEDADVAAMASTRKNEEVLGELGHLILQHDDVYPPIVLLIFVSLSWEDGPTCMKAVVWCYPVLKQLVALQKVTNDYANDVFRCLLFGLHVHGQHDSILYTIINALVQVYELLVPHFPSVRELMLKIPGCSEDKLHIFNTRIICSGSQTKNSEKKKREYFKSMVEGAIGKNIGQRFKNPVHIKNLPPFNLFRHKQKELLLQEDAGESGLCALFKPED